MTLNVKSFALFGLGLASGIGLAVVSGALLFGHPQTAPTAPIVAPTHDASRYEVQLESDRVSINGLEATKTEFDGNCTLTSVDGSSETTSITGVAPQAFTYTTHGLSCTYQKQRRNDDRLKVIVTQDGRVVKSITTDLEHGVVSFAI